MRNFLIYAMCLVSFECHGCPGACYERHWSIVETFLRGKVWPKMVEASFYTESNLYGSLSD